MSILGSHFRFQIRSGAPISPPTPATRNKYKTATTSTKQSILFCKKHSILSTDKSKVSYDKRNGKTQTLFMRGNYFSTAIGFSPRGVILIACLLSPSKSKIAL